jgi:hypothetical protein
MANKKVLGWVFFGVAMIVVVIAAAAVVTIAYQNYQRKHNVWWQPTASIRAYLLEQTPLGVTEEQVLVWLGSRGVGARINRNSVRPDSDYPVTMKPGEAWTQVVLDRHGFPFETYVEVFYIFDGARRLVDIGVRKTVDAL